MKHPTAELAALLQTLRTEIESDKSHLKRKKSRAKRIADELFHRSHPELPLDSSPKAA